jgi:hypothetical protein
MKNIITSCLIAAAGLIVLGAADIHLGKRDGTEPGHTGSPGDTLKNCTVCHGGTAVPVEGWITSDIPAAGYTPGQTYHIKATNTEHGGTRFGFQVSPQALDGTLLGTLVITDTVTTQLVGNKKYVTYRAAGVEGVDSLSWTFDWIAPVAGTGEVIFYGAFNSNENGHKGGDQTYLSKLTVQENTSTGIAEKNSIINDVVIYPNPAKDAAEIGIDLKNAAMVSVQVTDLSGKNVISLPAQKSNGAVTRHLNTSNLSNGTYLVRIEANGKVVTRKLTVMK